MISELLFEVPTPLGFSVRCTRLYWEFITTYKHPTLKGREAAVQAVLRTPNSVRRSRKDSAVLLFYGDDANRLLCAVVRREDGTGFLITAYPAEAPKIGEVVWTRSK